MSTATYYFNGAGGTVDAQSVWTNESNILNGDTSTYATVSSTSPDSGATNGLLIAYTNADPYSVGVVTQVRARLYGRHVDPYMHGDIYSVDAELLGSILHTSGSPSYGSYVTLSAPSAGWSFSQVAALSVALYSTDSLSVGAARVYNVEVEVTYTVPSVELRNVQTISNVVSITL